MAALGVCFPRDMPAAQIVPTARALEASRVAELWLVEDCFYTTGVSLAAAALAVTEQLTVGLGILPAVVRNPALTAMELATLSALGPRRLIAGIGHGMQDWMDQIGARAASPLTALQEVLDAVRALLRGSQVSVAGRSVSLRDVALEFPPVDVPPVLAGVRGPKSIAMAGRHADGLVLADGSPPAYVRWARERAGASGRFEIAVLTVAEIDADRETARRRAAPRIADMMQSPPPGLCMEPFFGDLAALVSERGSAGVLSAPDEWWSSLGAIGTPEDAAAHLDALGAAGADHVGLAFGSDPAQWHADAIRFAAELSAAQKG
jgi:alkanesulfonate monooxygenase SsuD/methylene tetrahydromethanopterin reductase-like flavin-dependent oxidoreductase (luciferase family)